MFNVRPLTDLDFRRFEHPAVLRQLNAATRRLAELKGVVSAMPKQSILISTLGLQEAKDSSEIENIVTTHDALFRESVSPESRTSPATREVARYARVLRVGFDAVRQTGLLTNSHILSIQAELEQNLAGFRKLPGTSLRTSTGQTVFTPPQDPSEILELMTGLERFINEDELFEADPLIKMALIHHQFETIHPFYDGNGRTGRIINVLYLVKQGLLDIPVLYLSRHIVQTKSDYYRLLQAVRDKDAWEEWVIYMLEGVEKTSEDALMMIAKIKGLLADYKHRIREGYRFYSQDLINNLFSYPYTKIEFIERDLNVSRLTATKYLEALVTGGLLEKQKVGRTNYFINRPLVQILSGVV